MHVFFFFSITVVIRNARDAITDLLVGRTKLTKFYFHSFAIIIALSLLSKSPSVNRLLVLLL